MSLDKSLYTLLNCPELKQMTNNSFNIKKLRNENEKQILSTECLRIKIKINK